MRKVSLWFVFIAIFAAFLLLEVYRVAFGASSGTNITVHNSFAVGTLLETKCDWSNRTQGFLYFNRIMVPGKTNKTISVPPGMRNCEVWVIKIFLLGGPK